MHTHPAGAKVFHSNRRLGNGDMRTTILGRAEEGSVVISDTRVRAPSQTMGGRERGLFFMSFAAAPSRCRRRA